MGHGGEGGDALWTTAENLQMHYRLLQQIWWCTMDHCSVFGYALGVTAADLVIRYGPLGRIWLWALGRCCEFWYCALGHCGVFGYALWVTAEDLDMRHRPLREMKPYSKNLWRFPPWWPWCRILLCAIGNSVGFSYVPWAITPNQWPWHRTTPFFWKLAKFFKRTVRYKKWLYIDSSTLGLCLICAKLISVKKNWFLRMAQSVEGLLNSNNSADSK